MKVRNILIPVLCLLVLNAVHAQEEKSGGVIKFKLKTTPELLIEEVKLFDENKNNTIDANENCYFQIQVKNSGQTAANYPIIEASLASGNNTAFIFEKKTNGEQIEPGQTSTIRVDVLGNEKLVTGQETFRFILSDAGKYASKPITKIIKTKKRDIYLLAEWKLPSTRNTNVTETKINIDLCIKSEIKIEEIMVYVNNKIKHVSRGFKVVENDGCDHKFNEEVNLEIGLNEIKVKINTKGKTITTESRFVKCSPLITEYRNALVIGNSKYLTSPLRNPYNDAKAMAKALRELNFNVIEVLDGDKKTMRAAVREFNKKMKEERGVGLFYYAGHGVQVKGENYLIPVNNDIQTEYDVQDEALRVNTVLSYMQDAGTRMNIVILDACRDNPFASFMRSGTRGLAIVHAEGSGSIIAYATAPGSTASDGSGKNGLYTQELLKAIKTPGLEIGMVFRDVLANVQKLSNGKQVPWTNSSITGEFYFSK